jgi:hypothetical protein
LECDSVQSGRSLPTFRMNILLPSSRSAEQGTLLPALILFRRLFRPISTGVSMYLSFCFLGLFFDPEDGGSMLFRNTSKLILYLNIIL